MILLRCSNCGQTLEIDDAFAGGVCRCRHCGTIQAVPADAPRGPAGAGGAAGDGQAVAGSKPLYRREEHLTQGTSGLDQLADVVAGSGMQSSGLHRTARRGGSKGIGRSDASRSMRMPAGGRKKPVDRRLATAVGVAAVLFVAAAGLAVALLTRGGPASKTAVDDAGPPTFAGLPLGRRVIFLLDRGEQTQPSLRALDQAVLDTVARLPATAQFQVIYWANKNVGADLSESPVVALPGRNLRDASEANRELLRKGVDEVVSGGATDVMPALDLALRNNPDTIVLATGKAWQLGGDFAAKLLERVRDRESAPTIHTVAVGSTSDGPGAPMDEIARATGGRFIGLTTNALRDLPRP